MYCFVTKVEQEMEAANMLNREATGGNKTAKSKNKGMSELRNLISLSWLCRP